jgi:hypothetical protein
LRRNTVAINNVSKKTNYKTKFSIGSILKKSTNIILKNKKIEKLCGKTPQQYTVFSRKKITKQNFKPAQYLKSKINKNNFEKKRKNKCKTKKKKGESWGKIQKKKKK